MVPYLLPVLYLSRVTYFFKGEKTNRNNKYIYDTGIIEQKYPMMITGSHRRGGITILLFLQRASKIEVSCADAVVVTLQQDLCVRQYRTRFFSERREISENVESE
jgi:hypothetical protein